jgi:hypothetical protein
MRQLVAAVIRGIAGAIHLAEDTLRDVADIVIKVELMIVDVVAKGVHIVEDLVKAVADAIDVK